MRQIVFVSANLLGDCLCTTPTVRAFRRRYPDAFITYIAHNEEHCRILEGNPDIDRIVFSDDLLEQAADEALSSRLGIAPDDLATIYRFDLHALHHLRPNVFQDHICRGFGRMMNIEVESVRPVVQLDTKSQEAARAIVHGRSIVLGMHSNSPVVGRDGEWVRKDWMLERWLQLAKELRSWGGYEVVAVGGPNDREVPSRHLRNIYGLPIRVLGAMLAEVACVVTVESGLAHLCHAVDAPTVLIFSRDVPLTWTRPEESSRCQLIYKDPRLVDCDQVLAAVRSVLAMNVAGSRTS